MDRYSIILGKKPPPEDPPPKKDPLSAVVKVDHGDGKGPQTIGRIQTWTASGNVGIGTVWESPSLNVGIGTSIEGMIRLSGNVSSNASNASNGSWVTSSPAGMVLWNQPENNEFRVNGNATIGGSLQAGRVDSSNLSNMEAKINLTQEQITGIQFEHKRMKLIGIAFIVSCSMILFSVFGLLIRGLK